MKKNTKISAILLFLAFLSALSCSQKTEEAAPADTKTYNSTGVVKIVDTDAGKITIDHEEIPGYMGAMEMNEKVSDAKMVENLKAGDKIEFELQRTNANLLITQIKKIGEVTIVNGGEIYKMNCAECHGGLGEGATKGISLLTGHALNHSEKEYAEQVTNGEGKKMPAFKDKLSPEQIAAVVKFIREDLQKDISPEERAKHKH